MRTKMEFEEFKRKFIDRDHHEYAWHPVYCSLDKNQVNIDLICHYRLMDGKLLFLQIEFENRSQLAEIVKYMVHGAAILLGTTAKNARKLLTADNPE